mmetsp:Transcript_8701/g.14293  ORF Transcript_8701/g.14293 Transcript_8701/m.14293 type:complete len:340 (-) Transcript_8701:133-1152(-)
MQLPSQVFKFVCLLFLRVGIVDASYDRFTQKNVAADASDDDDFDVSFLLQTSKANQNKVGASNTDRQSHSIGSKAIFNGTLQNTLRQLSVDHPHDWVYELHTDPWQKYVRGYGMAFRRTHSFELRGFTGSELVAIREPFAYTVLGQPDQQESLTTGWQTYSVDSGKWPGIGFYFVMFQNDGRTETNADRNVGLRTMVDSHVFNINKHREWTCGSTNENGRCEQVRNGNFLWGAQYSVFPGVKLVHAGKRWPAGSYGLKNIFSTSGAVSEYDVSKAFAKCFISVVSDAGCLGEVFQWKDKQDTNQHECQCATFTKGTGSHDVQTAEWWSMYTVVIAGAGI